MSVKRLVILILLVSMLLIASYSLAVADSINSDTNVQESAQGCKMIHLQRPGDKLGIWICV